VLFSLRPLAALALLLAVLATGCSPPIDLSRQAPPTRPGEPAGYAVARVMRVIDGDTVEVRVERVVPGAGAGEVETGRRYHVRLIGIDTPETVKPGAPVDCFGHEASAATDVLLEGKRVLLVKDVEETDAYGRLLRYVYLGDELVGARLVVNGYARAFPYPPNLRHAAMLAGLQRYARSEEIGLWSPDTCDGRR
jgi:micrococcal nuclease